MQITYSHGTTARRVIWWPRFGQVGVRVCGSRWLSLYWLVDGRV